jgi:hypothetical protein
LIRQAHEQIAKGGFKDAKVLVHLLSAGMAALATSFKITKA